MKIVRSIVLVSVLILLNSGNAFSLQAGAVPGGIKWNGYKEGLTLARETGKKVYINFHASWCGYCVKMEKTTFRDKSVIDYLNSNFVSIRVDTEKEGKIAQDYGVRGLPSNWFVENSGKKIGNQPGYLDAGQLLKILKFVTSEGYNK